jgi:hypothetical protein
MKSYIPFLIPGFITLLAVYLSHKSRMKLLRELKSEYETTTHQPAESAKTHKPTEAYIKFLEKPSKKKELRKFRLSRPSQSIVKTFFIGILILFIIIFLTAILPNLFGHMAQFDDGDNPWWYASMILTIFILYALYLLISSIIRALYKFLTLLFGMHK